MKTRVEMFVAAAALLLATALSPIEARAEVNFNLGINIGPPVNVFSTPPMVVPIPGTYVYFVPGVEFDVYFYDGYWYRPFKERWYRARNYNGPWGRVYERRMPAPLFNLPPDYRRSRVYEPVPYGQLRDNWKRWQRERHWEGHEERREMRRDERRRDDRERYGEGRREHRENRDR